MGQQTHFDPPIPKPDMDAEVAPTVPDAQSTPNEVHNSEAVRNNCRTHDIVAHPPLEIPLTQNHLNKCLICILSSLPPSFSPFFSFVPSISAYVARDIPDNVDVPPVAAQGLLILMMIVLLES
jgi:hypothetical protein